MRDSGARVRVHLIIILFIPVEVVEVETGMLWKLWIPVEVVECVVK